MKSFRVLSIFILVIGVSSLRAERKKWTPDMAYNTKLLIAGQPSKSAWGYSKEGQQAEYKMLYLLEAHKATTLATLSLERRIEEEITALEVITQKNLWEFSSALGCMNDVVRCSFQDTIKHFEVKPNPDLLLMMLYHFEVYCYGGDGDESWPELIGKLQKLDPAITEKAKKLAVKGVAARNSHR